MILVVQKQFDKLELQRKHLLTEAAKLRAEQLIFRPTPESWCILEVFDHLMTAERNGLKYMRKKFLGIDKIPKANMMARFRSTILTTALSLPIKYKAPPAAAIARREYYDFDEMALEWDSIRQEWKEFLDQFDAPSAKKLVFKHPLAGMLTVTQAIGFIQQHVKHHIPQIARIKAHPDFPK
ncbi:MAG: DinB family protein [Chitinophagales bacterium]|nr:DinB family protein [Chitinophagales bacterium]